MTAERRNHEALQEASGQDQETVTAQGVLGYQKRDLAVPSLHAKRINVGGGIVHPTVLVDGRIVGTWKSKREKQHFKVMLEPFEQIAPEVSAGIEAKVEDIGCFWVRRQGWSNTRTALTPHWLGWLRVPV